MAQFTPFRVEVLFRHYRNDLPPGLLRALEPLKLRYEVIPTQDPHEDTAFGMISGHTELAEDDIGDWVLGCIGRRCDERSYRRPT